MANDNSVSVVVTAAAQTNANQAMACYYGDDPGSPEIAVALSASGSAPATHYGTNAMMTGAQATDMKNWPTGTLPTPVGNWADYGLDATSALAAFSASVAQVQVMTGGDQSTLGLTNFNALLATLGLQKIV